MGPLPGGTARLRIAIDVGGTFTDVVVAQEGTLTDAKALTTHGDYATGVLDGLRRAAEDLHVGLDELLAHTERIVHGTTVATNALLSGGLPPVALVMTEGLRDTLLMRRGARETPLWIRRDPPEVLVPRSRIFEFDGRMDRHGRVVQDPSPACLDRIVESLRGTDVAAVGISLMFSFLNGAHEELVARHLADALPGVERYTSSGVLPRIGYFERTSTVAVNAAVSPLLATYLASLEERLRGEGFAGSLLVLQSNGGAATPRYASENGVYGVLSGPSVGPISGLTTVAAYGIDSIISADMGGTSFDVSLVRNGEPAVTTDNLIGDHRIAVPAVEIHAIGAGGGSIVSLDRRGYLRVGPESAGSDPGPVSYGRGGRAPTITDANLILGYLDAGAFTIEGRALDVEAARQVMASTVAEPMGMSVEDAARGAYRLINAAMADAIREVSVRRGHDPRRLPLVVGGGAGPLHVADIATELQIPLVIVPRLGSTYCAFGGLVTDLRYEFAAAVTGNLADEAESIQSAAKSLEAQAREQLEREGFPEEKQALRFTLSLRYRGQFHSVPVGLPPTASEDVDVGSIAERFHALHLRQNGHSDPSLPVELVSLSVAATGMLDKPGEGAPAERDGAGSVDGDAHRTVYTGDGLIQVPVREHLSPAHTLAGPTVVQWPHTTIWIPAGTSATADQAGNICLHSSGMTLEEAIGRLHG